MRRLYLFLVGLSVVLGLALLAGIYFVVLTPGNSDLDETVVTLNALHLILLWCSVSGALLVRVNASSK